METTILKAAITNGYTTAINNIRYQLELGHTPTSMIDTLLEPINGLVQDYVISQETQVKIIRHFKLTEDRLNTIVCAKTTPFFSGLSQGNKRYGSFARKRRRASMQKNTSLTFYHT